MGISDRVWSAFTSMIKLEDKVLRQGEVIKAQQAKIENLSERLIRVETALEIGLLQSGAGKSPRRISKKP